MSQYSLFGAAAAQPSLRDLDGVLLGGGRWVRTGSGARLSVVVEDVWRADALAAEFGARGLAGQDAVVPATSGWSVRTEFSPDLDDTAERWSRGSRESPPADFGLTAGGLRLWTIAAGRRGEDGFLLSTARADDRLHLLAGAHLARLGLTAVSLGARGGPGWRITSVKRLRRLAELVGPPSASCGADWPDLA